MAKLATTPSQTVGPFFGFALPFAGGGQIVALDTPGAIHIEGQVFDGHGAPCPDALIEVWQADAHGRYPAQAREEAGEDASWFGGFGRCPTDPEGRFHFVTLKPGATDALHGQMQAPHLIVTVFARGLLRHLVTRMYFPDEAAANASDPVLNAIADREARATLIAHNLGETLRFDIHLQGDRETVFFAL